MRDAVKEYGCGSHQVQLPPRELRGLVESRHFGCCDAFQEQSDGRADAEAGSACRFYQPLRRQQRHAEGTPEAGGGPPSYIRVYQAKRHEVISISNIVSVLCFFILNYLVLVRVAAVMHEIFLYFYTPFFLSSR